MKNIHFISGLPRSGSTLLAAILIQNSLFCAGMTSPLYGIFAGALRNMSGHNEASPFIENSQRERILKAIVDAYFNPKWIGELKGFWPTYFDTSRSWTTKAAIIFDLFPNAKMICCVRNVAWIMDSFERILQKNKYQPSKMFGHNPHQNIYQRANQMSGPDGIIGTAYNNLREAFFGPYSDRLMLIDYNRLCNDPVEVMEQLYSFIGETPFEHEFSNVEYEATEFDERLGTPGLHSVSGPVRPVTARQPLLPPDIFSAHSESDFWNNPEARALSKATVL